MESNISHEKTKYRSEIESLLKDLNNLKNWRSEIPERLLSWLTAEPYKVRKNWFAWIVHIVDYVHYLLYLNNDIQYKAISKIYENDIQYFTNDEFNSKLTTQEDIKKWDEIINKTIQILEYIKQH